ncbi:hypothetical protein L291_0914 [Acinetobacter guillouiae MSP4-18]|nr:hypothetical protein L291_0914 [Acinetobacter guillouiae MSP4-18]
MYYGYYFLSCLYGSEPFGAMVDMHLAFLSCLYGSELEEAIKKLKV